MIYFMGSEAPKINILSLGLTMFFVTAAPVTLGLIINTNYKRFSISFSPLANKVSIGLFIVIVGGALASEWSTFIENLSALGPAIFLLIFTMLLVGYNSAKWAGINREQGITIAIESGIQNATVGIAIGNLILNNGTGISVLSLPSGVYGILMYIVCLPFVFWVIKSR